VGVDEARHQQAAGVLFARPAGARIFGLHGGDAAVFTDQQPLRRPPTHTVQRRAAPGRGGGEVQKIGADGPLHAVIRSSDYSWHRTVRSLMNPRPIRFFHRGSLVSLSVAEPTRTVLDWLREDAQCIGTKEGCNEGDCGACTVVLGTLSAAGALQLRPVNSCIQFLPTLDGKALFTVQDVAAADGTLHPVQQALVDHHGSQCGFCTPGFVMSLWAVYQRHSTAAGVPTRQQLADDLSGNLCRCTGYRPILDAGQAMFDLPPAKLDTRAAEDALRVLQAESALNYQGRFFAPRTLQDLATLREQKQEALLLAGSTDIGLWVNKQFRAVGELIHVGEVAEMKQVRVDGGLLHIGAAASLEDAFTALVRHWPTLHEVWLRFASLPIRVAGTLGGNVANGSPIGDSAPMLMALDAQLVLRRGEQMRRLPLSEFYLGYMKNRLQPGEFLQAVEVPLNDWHAVRSYKISKRFDSDISAVCAGLSLVLHGGLVHDVRLAFGGMAATVRRAAAAEAALVGQPWAEASVSAAMQALAHDFQPLSDMRASAAYRLQVAQNLIRRFWLETRLGDPLPSQAVSVWAAMPRAVR
jgi:xanthine dehydrogenase small subunit